MSKRLVMVAVAVLLAAGMANAGLISVNGAAPGSNAAPVGFAGAFDVSTVNGAGTPLDWIANKGGTVEKMATGDSQLSATVMGGPWMGTSLAVQWSDGAPDVSGTDSVPGVLGQWNQPYVYVTAPDPSKTYEVMWGHGALTSGGPASPGSGSYFPVLISVAGDPNTYTYSPTSYGHTYVDNIIFSGGTLSLKCLGGYDIYPYWQFATVRDLTPPEVPEPSTMLLLGTGVMGAIGYARRRMMK